MTRFSEQGWNADEELSLLATLPDPQPLQQEWVEEHDLEQALHQGIEALPETMRSVMLLQLHRSPALLQDWTGTAYARGTAKISFQWARKRLHTALVT